MTIKGSRRVKEVVIPSIDPIDTITIHVTFDKAQFQKLAILRKENGLLNEQEVIRFITAQATKHITI